MNKVFGILLVLLNFVSSSSWGCNYLGADYQAGVKAYNNGDFDIYLLGWGVPGDWEYAYMWSNIAASSGDETAKAHLRNIQKFMTKEAIIKAQRLTRPRVAKEYKDC